MSVVPLGVGFESEEHGHGLLHADFANAFIGGGVLSGGCVQEEIRFAICPELTVGCLICPVMLDPEAIQVVGAQQYSAYTGYMWKLRFAGDYHDNCNRDLDGTVLNGIAAIDALDGRSMRFTLPIQLQLPHMLRELNKACAGFNPADPRTAGAFPELATGNW